MIKSFVTNARLNCLLEGYGWGDFPTLVDCMLSNGNGEGRDCLRRFFFFLTIRGSEETFIIFVF